VRIEHLDVRTGDKARTFFSPSREAILIGKRCTEENVFSHLNHEYVHLGIYNVLGKWESSLYDNIFNVLGCGFGESGEPTGIEKFSKSAHAGWKTIAKTHRILSK
jgi:hypothetical protein